MEIPMTPEERFTRIENFLSTVAEHQAHMSEHQAEHDTDIKELREIQKGVSIAIMKVAQAHHATEEKLNALIATVDRVIGSQGKSPS